MHVAKNTIVAYYIIDNRNCMLLSQPEMDLKQLIVDCALQLDYDRLNEEQLEVITSYIQSNDTFVSLPTG